MATNETDEIEKIMGEIEELQKEMAAPQSQKKPAAPEASMSGVEEDILREIQANVHSGDHGGDLGGGLEDTLAELKQEEAAGGVLAAATQPEISAEEGTMSYPNTNGDGTLSLTLTGNMTLKLKYEFEGQEVTISFVDQALRVQMTDGTEFKVPFARGTNVKPFKKAV